MTPNKRRSLALVLDLGTTGVKAFVFNKDKQIIGKAYQKLGKNRPQTGWVEQDPQEILRKSKQVLKKVITDTHLNLDQIIGLGITNQREAVVVWNSKNGRPVYPVIGWEDQRTKAECQRLQKAVGKKVREKTGLSILPYFSASKIHWILDQKKTAASSRYGNTCGKVA